MATTAPRRSNKPSRRVLGCGLAVLLLAIAGYLFLNWSPQPHFDRPDLKTVAKRTGLRFPGSAVLIESSSCDEPLSSKIYAKIRLRREDAGAFFASLPRDFKRSRSERLGIDDKIPYPKKLDWWRPNSVRNFETASFEPNPMMSVRVLADLDGSDATLYIQWSMTT